MYATLGITLVVPGLLSGAGVAVAEEPVNQITRVTTSNGLYIGSHAAMELDKDATDTRVITQRVTYSAGAESGYHFHNGHVLVSVVSGTFAVLQNEVCPPTIVQAGDVFLEHPGQKHNFKNVGNVAGTIVPVVMFKDGATPTVTTAPDNSEACRPLGYAPKSLASIDNADVGEDDVSEEDLAAGCSAAGAKGGLGSLVLLGLAIALGRRRKA